MLEKSKLTPLLHQGIEHGRIHKEEDVGKKLRNYLQEEVKKQEVAFVVIYGSLNIPMLVSHDTAAKLNHSVHVELWPCRERDLLRSVD